MYLIKCNFISPKGKYLSLPDAIGTLLCTVYDGHRQYVFNKETGFNCDGGPEFEKFVDDWKMATVEALVERCGDPNVEYELINSPRLDAVLNGRETPRESLERMPKRYSRTATPRGKTLSRNEKAVAYVLDVTDHPNKLAAHLRAMAKGNWVAFVRYVDAAVEIKATLEADREAKREKEKAKIAKIEEVQAQVREMGIDWSEFLEMAQKLPKSAGRKDEKLPRYQVFTDGEFIDWNGVGPVPNKMRSFLQQNPRKSLEDLRVA